MSCADVRPQLTAYLDGELEGDRGSAVRGHLRGCDACRSAANDEAALRDGLRGLPALDAPPELWAGIQRQLATAEVADAQKPRWRRVLARWSPQQWLTPRFALASAALAVVACVWAWRFTHHPHVLPQVAEPVERAPIAPSAHDAVREDAPADVAAEIAALPKTTSDSYAAAATELAQVAQAARMQWAGDRQQQFDATLAALQHDVETAVEGRPRHKAYRTLIRYLQRVTTRDEVAFADTRGTP